jgi:hypothetical protein
VPYLCGVTGLDGDVTTVDFVQPAAIADCMRGSVGLFGRMYVNDPAKRKPIGELNGKGRIALMLKDKRWCLERNRSLMMIWNCSSLRPQTQL